MGVAAVVVVVGTVDVVGDVMAVEDDSVTADVVVGALVATVCSGCKTKTSRREFQQPPAFRVPSGVLRVIFS